MPKLQKIPILLEIMRRTPIGDSLGVMNRVFGPAISQNGICWVKTATGYPWKVDLSDSCHRWMVYGDYSDSGFWNWARNNISEDGIIVDSGTNIGQFIPYYAEILEGGHILGFEPSSYCREWVRECLAVNPDIPIEIVPKGFGSQPDHLTLKNTEAAHGLWGTVSQDESSGGEEVTVTTLTDSIRDRDIREISLWKLDVEGHEFEALKGAEALLAEGRIQSMFVEVHPENRRKEVEYLEQHGYSAHRIQPSGELTSVHDHPREETNLLFLHRSALLSDEYE
ncbi:FkbM family methyltransferase [Salinibacter ruber]|uniref:FkbM family methyltransferase n=1 Tax=Salinibacter ruber TaxID=146919 RepID=UPI0021697254|nr:FkbM family methyltransferase [Salinibacter ruber]MCS3827480.1 FkbM family methyltransferase [Salinibacter ruber]